MTKFSDFVFIVEGVSTLLTNSLISKGLARKSSAPISLQISAASGWADISITFILAVSGLLLGLLLKFDHQSQTSTYR
ncbi:MAG: hypothetical protein LC112_04385 [Flavobacteriales bacterium]|nr:hypothetical protein [Flavobacteriales bacterium]